MVTDCLRSDGWTTRPPLKNSGVVSLASGSRLIAALISASVMRLSRAQSVPVLRLFAVDRFIVDADFVCLGPASRDDAPFILIPVRVDDGDDNVAGLAKRQGPGFSIIFAIVDHLKGRAIEDPS